MQPSGFYRALCPLCSVCSWSHTIVPLLAATGARVQDSRSWRQPQGRATTVPGGSHRGARPLFLAAATGAHDHCSSRCFPMNRYKSKTSRSAGLVEPPLYGRKRENGELRADERERERARASDSRFDVSARTRTQSENRGAKRM